MSALLVICGLILSIGIRTRFFQNRPGIILITIDALRPDHLGCYGYERNTSPNIDSLSRQGVLFTQAISQSSHTAPSNSSLITSSYVQDHRVEDWGYQISRRVMFLPKVLSWKGYTTAFISNQYVLPLINGFLNGFGTFKMMRRDIKEAKKHNAWVTDQAIDWLRHNSGKKFFLWVYYLGVHGPYAPPAPFDTMFLHDAYSKEREIPVAENDEQFVVNRIPGYVARGGITDTGYYISLYDGEIRAVDHEIGRLISEIRALQLDKRTIVVLTADHGEGMGEHDAYFCHSTFLYDEFIRIPLIVIFPEKKNAGKKIGSQVRSIDIMPTFFDAAGMPYVNLFLKGKSLIPLVEGTSTMFPAYAYSTFLERHTVRTNDWKLIFNTKTNTYELFDLRRDPREKMDLSGTEKDMFDTLFRRMKGYLGPRWERGSPRRALSFQNVREQLRSLGYVQ